jgi:small conductance mechanosensitive channel
VDPGFFHLGLSAYFVRETERYHIMQITENDAFKEAEGWVVKAMDYIVEHGPNVLWALLIYIVGSWLVKRIVNGLRSVMQKSKYDESLQRFLMNLISWLLKIVLIVVVVSRLGVDVTMFAAIFAAAGLAVGLALQGSLSNFAGGVLIAIFKPYRIGDLVETQDILGVVKDIDIFTTKMVTPQNKLAIIPNGPIANGNIINYTIEGKMRVDIVVGVAYEEDIKKSKEVLLGVLTSNPKVLQDPPPSVNVLELAESSVNFAVRPFCKPEDYWEVYFATQEGCKLALDEAGIEIPYPHSVEIHKEE